jgi:hypothetical protein
VSRSEGPVEVPVGLSEASAEWWRHTTSTWHLEAHHLRLLEAAARAWDRSEEARAAIELAGGPFFNDRFGQPRQHPAVRVEIESRRQFTSLLRELNLDEAAAPAAPRRPTKWRA